MYNCRGTLQRSPKMEHENLFKEVSEILKGKGVQMSSQEVEDFCLGGESFDEVLASDLANEICEYMGL